MTAITLPDKKSYSGWARVLGSLWFALLALVVAAEIGVSSGEPWPSRLSSFCLAIFYLLLALMIMTRPPAKAEAEGLLPRIAGFAGTYLPWSIALFGTTERVGLNLASSTFVLTGLVMMLVTVRHLGRSFSIVPQARSVVQTGPYRWVKHPLYLAEEIALIGVALRAPMPATLIILVLHFGVQVCRILYEEDLLRHTCPEYSGYEASRWRLIPYVW